MLAISESLSPEGEISIKVGRPNKALCCECLRVDTLSWLRCAKDKTPVGWLVGFVAQAGGWLTHTGPPASGGRKLWLFVLKSQDLANLLTYFRGRSLSSQVVDSIELRLSLVGFLFLSALLCSPRRAGWRCGDEAWRAAAAPLLTIFLVLFGVCWGVGEGGVVLEIAD